ncbi:MAG: hypothetical protein ACRENP_05540 [Longimicrobiales bacterium]
MKLHTEHRSERSRPDALRLLARLLVIFQPLLASCSVDATDPFDAPAEIAGRYTLADVGGNRLPTTIYEGPWQLNGQRLNVQIAIRSSTLQLTGQRYSLLMQLEATAQGQTVPVPIADEGEYRRSGERIDFHSDDETVGSFVGHLRGTGITVSIDLIGDGHPPTFLFRK